MSEVVHGLHSDDRVRVLPERQAAIEAGHRYEIGAADDVPTGPIAGSTCAPSPCTSGRPHRPVVPAANRHRRLGVRVTALATPFRQPR